MLNEKELYQSFFELIEIIKTKHNFVDIEDIEVDESFEYSLEDVNITFHACKEIESKVINSIEYRVSHTVSLIDCDCSLGIIMSVDSFNKIAYISGVYDAEDCVLMKITDTNFSEYIYNAVDIYLAFLDSFKNN